MTVELTSLPEYQELIELSSDIFTVVDDRGVIQYESPSIASVLGYEPDELVGESIFAYIHPDDLDRTATRFESFVTAAEDTVRDVEYRFRAANGSWVWLESVASNRTESALGGYVVTSRDITDRKADAQRLATLSEELELLNRVLRHDIRNDMNIILGWAQQLERHVDAEGQDALRKIQASGEHITELTEIARDYVASLSDEPAVETRPIRLRQTIHTEVDLRREAYPAATITIADDCPDVTVRADDMLSSVVRNLVNNAVQHNDSDHPTVTISVAVADDHVVLRVADDGPGIPDAQAETIFGKGEKGLESPGSGIGLYLVRSLVEQYGGAVWIEDNEPRGAIFTVRLQRSD